MSESTAIDAPKINLLDLDRAGMEAFFVELGEKRFRAHQVMKWIYHHLADDFDAMTDLGKSLRETLRTKAEVRVPKALVEQRSVDGTCKWLLGLEGGNAIETVYIPEPRRGTLCVSSQIGCALNCTFCSTGTQGFNRNLTTAEIIGQVWATAKALSTQAGEPRRITNVVMMGMGEPLLNFDNVVKAMSLMRDDLGFGLANKRVTLSTAGLVPMIDRLSEASDVSLAVSLHAPTDALRDTLVPLNRKYPIAQLHPDAFKSHEAANCAADQGKYWQMHQSLFAGTPVRDAAQLTEKAKALGLDLPKFNTCLSSGRHAPAIRCRPRNST